MSLLFSHENRLLLTGLLIGIFLILMGGLRVVVKRKPNESYMTTEVKNELRVVRSKQVVIYYLAVATAFLLLNLLTIVLVIVVFGPLNEYQWASVIILGTPGLVSYAVFLFLMFPRKWHAFDFVFDRSANQLLHGNTVVSSISNIRHLQIQRKENRETSKTSYALSLIMKEGESRLMYEAQEPAAALFTLSKRISEYLGTQIFIKAKSWI